MNAEETEGESTKKRARVDEDEENKPLVEQNGTGEAESMDPEDDDVQEIKVNVPVVEVADEDDKVESAEADVAEPEPIKESPVTPTKTTPTRGRGGRARGSATRRGRSNR